jgi:hypothetical protein
MLKKIMQQNIPPLDAILRHMPIYSGRKLSADGKRHIGHGCKNKRAKQQPPYGLNVRNAPLKAQSSVSTHGGPMIEVVVKLLSAVPHTQESTVKATYDNLKSLRGEQVMSGRSPSFVASVWLKISKVF